MCSYLCWQDDSISIDPHENGYGRYGFVVLLRFRYQRENPDDAEVLHSYRRAFFLRRHQLLSGNEYQYQKGTFLLLMHGSYLPKSVQESIVNDSIMKADSMAKDPNNAYRKILPIAVEILIRSEAAAIACRRGGGIGSWLRGMVMMPLPGRQGSRCK